MSRIDVNSLPPSIQPLASVAIALHEWREAVVFIGGAVAPLLQSHPPFPRVRPTMDVDAVSGAVSYVAQNTMDDALLHLGFRRDLGYRGHAHRWIAPNDIAFDLAPAADFLGGSGNKWDQFAIQHATQTVLSDGLTVRHVSAPFFLVLKWAAYCDRGQGTPLLSTDLEDFVALLAARPTLTSEIATMPQDPRDYLRDAARAILSHPDCDDVLEAHLNNATPRHFVVDQVREVLRAMTL